MTEIGPVAIVTGLRRSKGTESFFLHHVAFQFLMHPAEGGRPVHWALRAVTVYFVPHAAPDESIRAVAGDAADGSGFSM